MSVVARLLRDVPKVFVGPDARRALSGDRGLLLGSKRPEWVDVLAFDGHAEASWRRLVALRFEDAGLWEVVGIGLSSTQFRAVRKRLLGELVPGDVVVTDHGPSVHLGDTWRKAPLKR